jgi:hypothetical protein
VRVFLPDVLVLSALSRVRGPQVRHESKDWRIVDDNQHVIKAPTPHPQ